MPYIWIPEENRMYGKRLADDRPTLIYCRESRDENSEEYERIET